MNRFFYYLLFISVFMASCSNEGEKKEGEKPYLPNNFVISGKIMGAANQPVRLESMTTKGMIKIAETTISVSGDFELIGNVKGMGLYVGTTGTKSIPLCDYSDVSGFKRETGTFSALYNFFSKYLTSSNSPKF